MLRRRDQYLHFWKSKGNITDTLIRSQALRLQPFSVKDARRGAMEDMIYKGSVLRIKKCAFDFLSLEEDLIDDDDDSWELMGRDLRLKSTFLYCDLNHVISNSHDEHKKTLTDLGNKLFYFMEELDQAVKSRSISLIQIHYNDAAHVLQEVIMSLH